MTRLEKALGRWINPALSAVVLAGYLITGHPAEAVVTAPDSAAVAQMHSQSTQSSMTDVLHAALGTLLAAAWLMGGAWVGMRSARVSTPLDGLAVHTRNAHRL
jgi:hypothetical protein